MKKWIFVIAIAALIVLWPLLRSGFYVSDDGEWMVIRLSAFYQSLASGQFPVRYLGRLNNSYGYPVSNFLYPGFLYLGSLIHRMGVSFPDAVKIILGGSVIGSALIIFFSLRRRFSNISSTVGTLSFLFSPYLLYDLYRRGSVGEIFALLPSTLLVFAVLSNSYWLIAPSIAFLIVAHNTTAFLVGVAFIGVLFTQKQPRRFIWHVVIGLGLSTFFWAPAIFERIFVQFDSVTVSDPRSYFISMPQAMMLGIPTILCIALSLRIKTKKYYMFDFVITAIMIFVYFMALPISSVVWQIPFVSKVIQFPYRFLTLNLIFGPWIVARVLEQIKGMKRMIVLLVFAVLWFIPIVLQESSIQFVKRPIGYYTTNEGTTTVANEYMPRWVSELPRQRSLEAVDVLTGNVNIFPRRFTKEVIEATVEVKEEGLIQINKVYYPGWGVTVDNVFTPVDFRNQFGFMRIPLSVGTHTIYADFRETPQRFIADMISVMSVFIYIVFIRLLTKRT